MRLVTRTIHRAFPELDPFDDERCRRFIAAARRTWVARLIDWTASLATCLVIFTIALAAATLIPRLLTPPRWGIEPYWGLQTMLLVCGCIAGPLATMVTRDVALRLRIRHVLRRRGQCLHCRYSLLGLPVSASRTVTCPECRSVCDVDESMVHLATGIVTEAERAAPTPTQARAVAMRRLLTRRIAPALALLLIAAIGLREYFLATQAAAAMRLLPGSAPFITLAESLQPYRPESTTSTIDGWDLFDAAAIDLNVLERQLETSAPKDARGKPVRPRYDRLLDRTPGRVIDGTSVENPQATEEARRRMTRFREEGIFAKFDRMADAPRAVRQVSLASGFTSSPANMMSDPDVGRIRQTSIILAVRLRDAIEAGDHAETISSFRTLTALSRMCLSQVTYFKHLFGLRTSDLACGTLREGLVLYPEHFDEATLRSLVDAMREQRFVPRPGYPWKCYSLLNEMTVAWFFSQPSLVRFGKFTPKLVEMVYGPGGAPYAAASEMGPLGTLESTLAALKARNEAAERWASDPPWMRGPSPKVGATESFFVPSITLDPTPLVPQFDRWRLDGDGLLMHLAVEWWIREHGSPPPSLFEAAEGPLHLEVPKDPFSAAGPLHYRVLTPAEREQPEHAMHRGYLLYSAGGDLHDDGGVSPPRPFDRAALLESATYRAGKFDYVFNESAEK